MQPHSNPLGCSSRRKICFASSRELRHDAGAALAAHHQHLGSTLRPCDAVHWVSISILFEIKGQSLWRVDRREPSIGTILSGTAPCPRSCTPGVCTAKPPQTALRRRTASSFSTRHPQTVPWHRLRWRLSTGAAGASATHSRCRLSHAWFESTACQPVMHVVSTLASCGF